MNAPAKPLWRRRSFGGWIAGAAVVLLLAAPWLTSSVNLGMFGQVASDAVAVMSLALLTGRLGQFSLGQGAYLGIGAYTAILLTNAGMSWFLAVLPAALITGVIGGVAGLPALRIKGMKPLALISLGIAIVFPQFVLKFSDFSGGAQGLAATQPIPSVFGFNRAVSAYWTVVVVAVIVFVLGWTLVTSRTGRAFVAVRDQEIASRTLGINTNLTKVAMYAWTAAIAGISGWMFAMVNRYVAPADFTPLLSISLVLGMIIGGGTGNIVIGSVVGGLFLVYVRDFVPTIGFDPTLTPFVYGVILILVLLFLPRGAAGLLQDIPKRIRRRRTRSEPPVAPTNIDQKASLTGQSSSR
ncbi:branched-chain amino acid ABC transporter permease [Amycolatopsis sp. GM8]|uniref:branched-chain amino acid ABC transporter permease n=1 Tax=Amycolatopsis sp. GM8 TaxID=2896530 RepID=UPI001F2E0694|nr:branched-chain amino acid ABC transporter permease [Amycolatopsis sp. GM8]